MAALHAFSNGVQAVASAYLFHEQPTVQCETAETPSLREQRLISYEEVQKHATKDDCWVIINGLVYDMTDFLEAHPGGPNAIIQQAGKDASLKFQLLHPPDAIGTLPPEYCLGAIDPETLPAPQEMALTEDEIRQAEAREEMPQAADMLLVQDFENWAERVLSTTAWAYYRSASDEEATFHGNRDAWRRYFFRPRILRGDMSQGSTATTFLGMPTSIPIFIAPAAMAKLGHPLGEVNLTKAAGTSGIVQAISANASCGLEEMFNARVEGQPLVFQIYLNKDRSASSALIKRVTQLGASAIILTVDVCWQSKRTLDVRAKLEEVKDAPTPLPEVKDKSVSETISGYQDTNLTWSDIAFVKKHTHLPIIIKGVQSVEDVQLCVEHGAKGVIISNHGGRQADYAPAPIDVLYELRELRPDLFSKIDVMVDGGVRSGADVVKALALGAKAVGIGRPILYANGTHGEDGVERVIKSACKDTCYSGTALTLR
ncbi:glycolate oxidase [Paraphaeosphaeria minitans]|uniref:Glycolate oxidase n=1 Tax=Paraphaeosphaeria minitans TaxID=565426 RepID=A0A9P6GN44_9PLEO|nr:glycolate oxidase [Paraphaeosphaeria minitans]